MLSADGVVEVGLLQGDECCPPDICAFDRASMACNFINLLPSGPLWDEEKRTAHTKIDANGDYDAGDCVSLVAHSIYTGHKLHQLITGPLFSSIIESSPYTAYDTIDSWLDRMGWQDCYNNACRNNALGNLTPYEKISDCGRVFCGAAAPAALEMTVKHLTLVALSRLNVGGIKNNAFINWVLEPLGVRFEPNPQECPTGGDINDCTYYMQLTPFKNQLEEWTAYEGCVQQTAPLISAQYVHTDCNASVVRPALLAAHCIVLSMLHCHMKISIKLNT